MIIAIDIDGVVADFVHGLNTLLNKIDPKLQLNANFEPLERDGWKAVGVTDVHLKHAWEYIAHSRFWLDLRPDRTMKPLDWIKLQQLNLKHDIYFVTVRHTPFAKFHTETWLMEQGIRNPTVIVTQDKGSIVKGLKAAVFIDDDFDNIFDVGFASPTTRCYMKRCKWNASAEAKVTRKCNSLRDMLQQEALWEEDHAGMADSHDAGESAS